MRVFKVTNVGGPALASLNQMTGIAHSDCQRLRFVGHRLLALDNATRQRARYQRNVGLTRHAHNVQTGKNSRQQVLIIQQGNRAIGVEQDFRFFLCNNRRNLGISRHITPRARRQYAGIRVLSVHQLPRQHENVHTTQTDRHRHRRALVQFDNN